MKAVVILAGKGTRMYPLGMTTPKCLLRILNRALIDWTLSSLFKNGIEEVILVTDATAFNQQVREHIGQSEFAKHKITFCIQTEQKGTAHALQVSKEHFSENEDFIFLYGDDLYGSKNIAQVLAESHLVILGAKVNDPEKWGILQTKDDGFLKSIIEKPTDFVGDLASIGCMKLNSQIFQLYNQLELSSRGEFELTDSLSLLAKTQPLKVLEKQDAWIPIGYPWQLLSATEALASTITADVQGTVEENVIIKGNVILPKTSVIKSGTYIEGNVIIGENCVIGPNAYLRNTVVVGDSSKIGFSVEIKNSIIGHHTFISHLTYVGDSVIGNHVNIAASCVTANFRHDHASIKSEVKDQLMDTQRQKFGAIIGDNVKLGVGTLIYPGRKIWPDKATLPGDIVKKDVQ